ELLRLHRTGLAVAFLACGTANAADFALPILGYVNGRMPGSIFRVYGTPGAAVTSPAAVSDLSVRQMVLAPAGNHALAAVDPHGDVMVLRMDDGARAIQAVPDLAPAPDAIVFSPGGASAALYYKAEQVIRVVSGLPDTALVQRVVSVSGSEAGAIAVSDDGASLLAAFPATGSASLFTAGGSFGVPVP